MKSEKRNEESGGLVQNKDKKKVSGSAGGLRRDGGRWCGRWALVRLRGWLTMVSEEGTATNLLYARHVPHKV
jgi:hypothetical protein